MDRCYRIGQKKDVFVNFFDCGGSMDEVMRMLNTYKSQNASILLADGTELGAGNGGGMSYQEVSGLLARAIEAIGSFRSDHMIKNGAATFVPGISQELVDAVLNHTAKAFKEALRKIFPPKEERTSD